MPRSIRWLLLSLGALFFLSVVGVAAITWRSHLHEGTYYGPHTDILRIGERVVTAQSARGVVQSIPHGTKILAIQIARSASNLTRVKSFHCHVTPYIDDQSSNQELKRTADRREDLR